MEFKKKKSLGQNFLKSKSAIIKIVGAGEIKHEEKVLEIGPGEGILTEALLKTGATVIAVEKDDRLITILKNKFAESEKAGKFVLVHEDILNFNPNTAGLENTKYKLIANIPYYVTGEIIRLALSKWPKPEKIVLLVQKEVAERVTAKDEKQSLLSVSVGVYGQAKIAGIVKAGSFVPKPKVDSAILVINEISDKNLPDQSSENRFFEVVKAGFSHKRKMIAGNLKPIFGEKTQEFLSLCKIPPTERAENITISDWLCLAKY